MMPRTSITNHIRKAILLDFDWKFPLDLPKPTASGIKSIMISRIPKIEKYAVMNSSSNYDSIRLSMLHKPSFSLHRAQGSTINMIGVIITAEAISPEYKSRVINPDMSKTYCTISPVLNLTLRPSPKSKDCLFPSILRNNKKEPDNFALIVETKIAIINNG